MLQINFHGLVDPQDPTVSDKVTRGFNFALDRFKDAIRDIEVRFRDLNGPKGGVDKSCQVQLRFMPRGLVVVRGRGTTFLAAANIACNRVVQVLTRRLARRLRSKRRSKDVSAPPLEPLLATGAEAT